MATTAAEGLRGGETTRIDHIVIAAGRARNRPEGAEDMAEAEAGISGAMPTGIAAVTTIGITATSISITSSPPSMRWSATTHLEGSMLTSHLLRRYERPRGS